MSRFRTTTALGVLPATQRWARNCNTAPSFADRRAIDLLFRRRARGDWADARIKQFFTSEISVPACSLDVVKGVFNPGDAGGLISSPGSGVSFDGSTQFYDWGETFASLAASIGITPNDHAQLIYLTGDFGATSDGGASGGGISQCDVQARSPVSTLGLHAASPTRIVTVPSSSVFLARGYMNLGGASFAISRENLTVVANTTYPNGTLFDPVRNVVPSTVNVPGSFYACGMVDRGKLLSAAPGTTIVMEAPRQRSAQTYVVVQRTTATPTLADPAVTVKDHLGTTLTTLSNVSVQNLTGASYTVAGLTWAAGETKVIGQATANGATLAASIDGVRLKLVANATKILVQCDGASWSVVSQVEAMSAQAISTTPAATWPSGTLCTGHVSNTSVYTASPIFAHLIVPRSGLAKIRDIDDTFEEIKYIYRTRTAIYAGTHTPAFTGPYPFVKTSLSNAKPSGLTVSRLGQPPANASVTNATVATFPTSIYIGTPNAPFSAFDDTNPDPFQLAVMPWVNRGDGPTDDAPIATILAGKSNNTYGAIPAPVGNGRPAFRTWSKANIATLGQCLYILGASARNDQTYKPGGVGCGWLDMFERAFDVSAWAPIVAGLYSTDGPTVAAANAALYTDTNLWNGAEYNTGGAGFASGVMHFAYAAAHAEVFTDLRPSGYVSVDKVILPPTRFIGIRRLAWIYTDDEADDGRTGDVQQAFYYELADICHAFGLKLGASMHALDGSARLKDGWSLANAHNIATKVDRTYLKLARNAGDCAASFLRQMNALSDLDGNLSNAELPSIPGSKLGASVNIGGSNSPLTIKQATDINAGMQQYGFTDCWVVPAGANYKSRWNDPVNLAQAALLGISPTMLVGYGT